MDFFGHQQAARQATTRLVVYFVLAVLSIIVALHCVAALVIVFSGSSQNYRPDVVATFLNLELLGYVAAGTLAVVAIGSLFKTAELRSGGPAVAEALGATPVSAESVDRDERRLMNVVEEMAIASGTQMPAVYIMRDESGINAFAAGFSIDNAVVAVTRGTLTRLNRAELQGVIAHEFSHIFNGDMRLNIRLMGVLHGILLIALIGSMILRGSGRRAMFRSSSRSNGKGRALILIVAIALLVVGYLGVFFGRLIKASVSREREYLADASAVQFTRNPDGIAGALKKIGGFAGGSALEAPNAEIASHSYFGPGLKSLSAHMLATHPPLAERIRRIDPQWRGDYDDATAEISDTEMASSFAGGSSPATAQGDDAPVALTPDDAVARAGAPTPAHMDHAHRLLLQLPDTILGAAHNPYGARALAYAMVIDQDQSVWRKQLDLLRQHADPGVLRVMQDIHPAVAGLSRQSFLPLMTLCTAALRNLSREQYGDFRRTLEKLIDADGVRGPFEFALLRVLRCHLDRHFDGTKRSGTIHRSLNRRARECGVLLSALSRIGHEDPAAMEAAFQAGLSRLGLSTPPAPTLTGRLDFTAVDEALDRLEQVAPLGKRKLIAACAAAIASDGKVTVEEGEILRAVSDSLDVPMPPFLADGTSSASG